MKQILKYILENVLENLKFAEAKHSVSLALASGVIVFSANFLVGTFLTAKIFAILCVTLCALSVATSFLALSSRTVRRFSKFGVKKINSLIYFNNLTNLSPSAYIEAIKMNYNLPNSYEYDGFDLDLAKHIIASSKLASKKYYLFNWSLIFLIIGILSLVIATILMVLGF